MLSLRFDPPYHRPTCAIPAQNACVSFWWRNKVQEDKTSYIQYGKFIWNIYLLLSAGGLDLVSLEPRSRSRPLRSSLSFLSPPFAGPLFWSVWNEHGYQKLLINKLSKKKLPYAWRTRAHTSYVTNLGGGSLLRTRFRSLVRFHRNQLFSLNSWLMSMLTDARDGSVSKFGDGDRKGSPRQRTVRWKSKNGWRRNVAF